MKQSRLRAQENEGAYRYYSSRLREKGLDGAGTLVLIAKVRKGQPPCMVCSPNDKPCQKCSKQA